MTVSDPADPDQAPATVEAPRRAFVRRPAGARRSAGSVAIYSIWVRFLRLVVPVSAAAVLVAVFVYSGDQAGDPVLPGPAAAETTSTRIDGPEFVSRDGHGRPFSLIGDSARQLGEGSDLIEITRPIGEITLENGLWVALLADRATVDRETRQVTLNGDVQIYRDDGYAFLTDQAFYDPSADLAWSERDVLAYGPRGEVEAEGFRVEEGGTRIVFTGRSRLLLRGADVEGEP